MKKKLIISWEEFIRTAMEALARDHAIPEKAKPVFMKKNSYEPDSECYEIPEYVEIELE